MYDQNYILIEFIHGMVESELDLYFGKYCLGETCIEKEKNYFRMDEIHYTRLIIFFTENSR